MVEETLTLLESFTKLEKKVHGYDDYLDCNDESYVVTLESLRLLVVRIQKEHVFSSNEDIKELETDNLRLLLVPYYEAKLLCMIMNDRINRVKLGVDFFIEYLKLMRHYNLLEDD